MSDHYDQLETRDPAQRELAQLRACGRFDLDQRVAAADQMRTRRQCFDLQSSGRLGKSVAVQARQNADNHEGYGGGSAAFRGYFCCKPHVCLLTITFRFFGGKAFRQKNVRQKNVGQKNGQLHL